MIWPHDDTKSLLAFYGRPWVDMTLLAHVVPPFQLKYEGALVHAVLIHKRCADALTQIFSAIWDHYDKDQVKLDATGFTRYSGSYNYRNVRGATNLSCHAFGAALDFNADKLTLGSFGRFDQPIIDAFKSVGAYYGGDFIHRKDPMHFQFANEA